MLRTARLNGAFDERLKAAREKALEERRDAGVALQTLFARIRRYYLRNRHVSSVEFQAE
jgi:hypothetical protein